MPDTDRMTPTTMQKQINKGWGADSRPEDRPGVPMELEPKPRGGAHWKEPERQPRVPGLTRRAELDDLTPVFGSAQPPRGIAGLMRHAAYRIPEHHTTHWAMLLLADRVDVWSHRLKKLGWVALPAAGIYLLLRSREA